MGFGWLKAVPILGSVCHAVLDVYDRVQSNPKGRVKALHRLKEESEAAHRKALAEMEKNRKEFEESTRKSEEAANERLRSQRDENKKTIEALKNQFKEQEDKYDEEVQKMNEDHVKKMEKLRSETKEVREKAEMEHKKKLGKVENEHKNLKIEAKEKMEKTKIEGEKKISKVEEEKEEIFKERSKELDIYHGEMTKLMEIYQNQLREIKQRNRSMRIENANARQNQLEIENDQMMKKIDSNIQELLTHITVQNSKDVIKQFQLVIEPVYAVKGSLEKIKTECIPPHSEPLSIDPGKLDPDFSGIREQTTRFNNRVCRFRQYVISTRHTDPNLYNACNGYLSQMEKLMSNCKIKEICIHLPKAIEEENMKTIQVYDTPLNELCNDFSELKSKLDDGLTSFTSNYVTGQSTNQASIEQ